MSEEFAGSLVVEERGQGDFVGVLGVHLDKHLQQIALHGAWWMHVNMHVPCTDHMYMHVSRRDHMYVHACPM